MTLPCSTLALNLLLLILLKFLILLDLLEKNIPSEQQSLSVTFESLRIQNISVVDAAASNNLVIRCTELVDFNTAWHHWWSQCWDDFSTGADFAGIWPRTFRGSASENSNWSWNLTGPDPNTDFGNTTHNTKSGTVCDVEPADQSGSTVPPYPYSRTESTPNHRHLE